MLITYGINTKNVENVPMPNNYNKGIHKQELTSSEKEAQNIQKLIATFYNSFLISYLELQNQYIREITTNKIVSSKNQTRL
jgi:uncharacterized ubiquitin-like protein YukD